MEGVSRGKAGGSADDSWQGLDTSMNKGTLRRSCDEDEA